MAQPALFFFFFRPHEPHGWLSNWSPHAFAEDGIRFKTAEHYLMFQKAILFEDHDVAAKILKASTPNAAKQLGRKVRGFDNAVWLAQREVIMLRGLTLKTEQHAEVKRLLLETNDVLLAEASPYDAIWGIGISKTDERAKDPAQWPGANLLGNQWMTLRRTLQRME